MTSPVFSEIVFILPKCEVRVLPQALVEVMHGVHKAREFCPEFCPEIIEGTVAESLRALTHGTWRTVFMLFFAFCPRLFPFFVEVRSFREGEYTCVVYFGLGNVHTLR